MCTHTASSQCSHPLLASFQQISPSPFIGHRSPGQQLQESGILRGEQDRVQVLHEFDNLLPLINTVVCSDGPRAAAAQSLALLEQGGGHLCEPVVRIWAGERDCELLAEWIDPNLSALVWRILELFEVPQAVPEETTGIAPVSPLSRVWESGTVGETCPRPDIDQVIQHFLPLLGYIAVAAFGDAVARQLAEAVLPPFEEGGWWFSEAAGFEVTVGGL